MASRSECGGSRRAAGGDVRANTDLPVFCTVFWCVNRTFKRLLLMLHVFNKGAARAENLGARSNYNMRCKSQIRLDVGKWLVGWALQGKKVRQNVTKSYRPDMKSHSTRN